MNHSLVLSYNHNKGKTTTIPLLMNQLFLKKNSCAFVIISVLSNLHAQNVIKIKLMILIILNEKSFYKMYTKKYEESLEKN